MDEQSQGEMAANDVRDAGLDRETTDFAYSMGRALGNCRLYGLSHSLTVGALEQCFELMNGLLEKVEGLEMTLADGELMINGVHLDGRNAHAASFASSLADLEAFGFSLSRGLPVEEFLKLAGILAGGSAASGGKVFSDLIVERQLEHITTRSASYRKVYDDEIVVGKNRDDTAGEDLDAEGILAFLQGGPEPGEGDALPTLEACARNAEGLTEVVLASSDVAESEAGTADGGNPGKKITESLRRLFDGLSKDPAASTQKGKKKLSRTLAVLEKGLLEKLVAMAAEGKAQASNEVSAAIEELQDEIKIDALVSEYSKRLKSARQSEGRILRYMERKGAGGTEDSSLREKMTENGVTAEDWRELVSAVLHKVAGTPTPGGIDGDSSHDAFTLQQVLTELNGAMESLVSEEKDGESSAGFHQLLTRAGDSVSGALARAEDRLDALEEYVRSPLEPGDKGISRKKILEILAEIVQEVSQPMSVISCCLELLLKPDLGRVNENQRETLVLADDSEKSVAAIVSKLGELSGLPATMTPDREITDAFK